MANLLMPKFGHLMEEGLVSVWLKGEGDVVYKGEIILRIETGKAVLDVESEFSGTLDRIAAEQGETVPVGGLLAVIDE